MSDEPGYPSAWWIAWEILGGTIGIGLAVLLIWITGTANDTWAMIAGILGALAGMVLGAWYGTHRESRRLDLALKAKSE